MGQFLSVETRRDITTEEMKEYAAKAAESIVIRSTVNGNSRDLRRCSTPEEADAIQRIIYGALLNIRFGCDIQSTANAAEFIGMQFLPGADNDVDEPHTNTYDTIYLPIKRWVALLQQKDAG